MKVKIIKLIFLFISLLFLDSFSFNFSSSISYLIIPVDYLGLANRLRVISSASILSKLESRRLIIMWKPSNECNVTFSSLFKIKNTSFDVIEFNFDLEREKLISLFTQLSQVVELDVILKFPDQFFVNISKQSTTTLTSTTSTSTTSTKRNNILVLRTLTSHSPRGMDCKEYMKMKSLFYHELQPVDHLNQRVQNIINNNNNNNNSIVGIHYRVYDKRYDWPILPPTSMTNISKSLTLSYDQSTPLQVVIESIIQISNKNSNVKFFLASNNLQTKKIIIESLKKNLLIPPKIFTSNENKNENKNDNDSNDNNDSNNNNSDSYVSRSIQNSIEDAVVDFFILGILSELILHTKGSSFGQEAAYLSKRNSINDEYYPISVIDLTIKLPEINNIKNNDKNINIEPLYVYTYSRDLESCGLPEYYNSIMKSNNGIRLNGFQEKKECFYERTGDEYDQQILDGLSYLPENERNGRMVCTYSQQLCRCKDIENYWGLNPIYCLNSSNSCYKHNNQDISEDFVSIFSEMTGI